MDFYDAHIHLIHGAFVTRKAWRDQAKNTRDNTTPMFAGRVRHMQKLVIAPIFPPSIIPSGDSTERIPIRTIDFQYEPHNAAYYGRGRWLPWSPTPADISAEDWETVTQEDFNYIV